MKAKEALQKIKRYAYLFEPHSELHYIEVDVLVNELQTSLDHYEELLKKETPMKLHNTTIGTWMNHNQCGTCGKTITKNDNYCGDCGQRIDWSDEE